MNLVRSTALAIVSPSEVRSMTLSPELLRVLVCPKCKGELEYRPADSALLCFTCRLRFAVRDDIPIMLLDEATAF